MPTVNGSCFFRSYWRLLRVVLWISIFFCISGAHGQVLHRRDWADAPCEPVALQFVAKHRDGSGAAGVTADQIRISFPEGAATVLSLLPFSAVSEPATVTSLLFVLPPFADAGTPADWKGIEKTLARHENFRFEASVLGPDGRVSPFSSDLLTVSQAFAAASASKAYVKVGEWERDELQAFLSVRHRPGRHVVIRLLNRSNPHRLPGKTMVLRDTTLDTAAAFDGAGFYQLLTPVDINLGIPDGSAAEGAMDPLGFAQRAQMAAASQQQSDRWQERSRAMLSTSGAMEATTDRLLSDVIADDASSYRLVVQPLFGCYKAHWDRVHIQSVREDVKVFGPAAGDLWPRHDDQTHAPVNQHP